MKRTHLRFCFGVLVTVATTFIASARKVENWSYPRLFEESDLVIIAQPVQSQDSADRTKDNVWKIEFTGVETKFDVLQTVKGAAGKSKPTVLHYRTDTAIEDGPSLVTFRTKGLSDTILEEGDAGEIPGIKKVSIGGPATYLLFLKKRADGRFEPVSGQTDPAFSVRELRMPAPLD